MGKTTEIHKKMQKKRIFPLLYEKNSFFFCTFSREIKQSLT